MGGRGGSLCCRGAVLSLPAEGAAGAEGLPPGGKQTQNKGPDIPSTGTAKSSLLFTGPICDPHQSRATLSCDSVTVKTQRVSMGASPSQDLGSSCFLKVSVKPRYL